MTSEYEQESPMDVYAVRLTARHARQARSLGDGNLSEGVRNSVEMAYRLKGETAKVLQPPDEKKK